MQSHRVLWLPLSLLLSVLMLSCANPNENMTSDGGEGDVPCSCATGARRCQGNSAQVCELSMPGCSSWGPAVACPTGMCSAGGCQGNCQDSCAAGTTRCSGDTAKEVCRIGPSGCLEWTREACAGGQYCDDAQSLCVPNLPCDVTCPIGYSCTRGGVCSGGDPNMLVLDVKTVQIAGKITLNGKDPLNGADCTTQPFATKASVALVEVQKGYSFDFSMSCGDSDFAFSGAIFPGTYKVLVRGYSNGGYDFSNLPLETFLADTGLVISGDTAGKVFDVKTVKLSGKITLNGANPVNGGDCAAQPFASKAYVSLTETTKGYSFGMSLSCGTTDFAFSGTVFPGTYKVTTQGNSSGGYDFSNLPLESFIADSGLVISGDTSGKVFDVKTVRLSGKITLNGAAPKNGGDCATQPFATKAFVSLRETTKGYSFGMSLSCGTTDFSYSGTLFPGTYRITTQGNSSGGYDFSNLPLENYLSDAAFTISADTTGKTLDTKTQHGSFRVTLNGKDPVVGADCATQPFANKAILTLTDTTKDYSFSYYTSCGDAGFGFSGAIYPGTYRVSVNGISNGGYDFSNLPLEPFIADPAFAVTGDVNGKVFDIKTVQFGGKLTLNGKDPVNGPDCTTQPFADKAEVFLRETTKGYGFVLYMSCGSSAFTFSQAIYPGTYRVTVNGLSNGGYDFSNLLLEAFLADPAMAITADTVGKVFDVKTRQIAGKVTLNGKDPVNGPDCTTQPFAEKAQVFMHDATSGYGFAFPMSCGDSAFTFSGTLYPATYRVTVQGYSNGGYDYSNLPLTASLAASRLEIP